MQKVLAIISGDIDVEEKQFISTNFKEKMRSFSVGNNDHYRGWMQEGNIGDASPHQPFSTIFSVDAIFLIISNLFANNKPYA